MELNVKQNRVNALVIRSAAVMLSAALMSITASAQNGRPDPQRPESQSGAAAPGGSQTTAPAATTTAPHRNRMLKEGKVQLAFSDTPVTDLIPLLVETTGKVVIPLQTGLTGKKITIVNDEPVDRAMALDLIITALRLNGVGVIETRDFIVLDIIENIKQKQPELLEADHDVMGRTDRGTFVVKIFRLKEARADAVHDLLAENLPDYATLTPDANSNQIIMYGDIGLAQHLQRLVNQLDRTHVVVQTHTFHLRYADANAVADQIIELFEPTENQAATGGGRPGRQQGRQVPARNQPGVPQPTSGLTGPGPVVELRVSVNVQQNAVTVSAEPPKVQAIAKLIYEDWDLPRDPGTSRMYTLRHTDPLKVQLLLQNLLGTGGGAPRQAGGRTAGRTVGTAGQAGQASAVSEVIGDIYRIEAYPDKNAVIILSKTKEALDYLDHIIREIDRPSDVGLPVVIQLKHASAISLAEELNVLLAESGTGGGLAGAETGLSGQGFGQMGEGGDLGTGGTTGGRSGGTTGGTGGSGSGRIEFPWQRGRARDDQSEPSPLIGKVRIVPIVRQNALSIVAPAEYRDPIINIIEEMDRPGRQVMLSAIIAEVELTDELALGIRVSSGDLVTSITDNSLSGSVTMEGTDEDIFHKLFDTSVLDASLNVNVLIQAIAQKTNVRILQEPRVFTADNQEAYFFDGQDIPFITGSSTTDISGIVQNFEYRQVGVILNVRPRITVERDVDLEVNLEISSIVPGQTLFGGAIVDRRQTTTKVIVKNGQTIVLSGILKDEETQISRGIPLLSDIPLIGELFKSRENSKRASELIAFITPTVVDNPSENDANFNRQERTNLRDLARPLKEQIKDRRNKIREKIVDPAEPAAGPPRKGQDGRREEEENDENGDDEPIDVDDLAALPARP